jgi:TRAP-type C4-dicarboxylate transport system substrate-binding protein
MKSLLVLIFLFVFTLISIFNASVDKKTSEPIKKWDMPTAYSEDNYQTIMANNFAKEINSCTNNTIDISVHGSGSLFSGHEIKRAVETNQVPIGERLLSSHFNDNPILAFDSLPFITESDEDVATLWKAAKPIITKALDEQGLVLLYAVPWPPQGMYFSTKMDKIEDLAGLKFRVYSSMSARIAELSNMVSVQIESAELNQALSIGVVQAIMASFSTGYDRKVWESLEYFYDLKAWQPRSYVFANKNKFNQLSDSQKKCFTDSATLIEKKATLRSIELTKWYRTEIEKEGIKIMEAPSKLADSFRSIGQQVVDEWLVLTGDEGKLILQNYHAEKLLLTTGAK